MFAPLSLWVGMFCPPSRHYDITKDPEQEAIKGAAAAAFAYSSMENIHPRTRPSPARREAFAFKTGST